MSDSIISDSSNAIEAAIEAGRRLNVAQQTPRVAGIRDAAPFLVLRDASGAERIEFLTERIDSGRKQGTVKLKDAVSFIAYFNKHCLDSATPYSPTIYATMQPARFIAVLNDHAKLAAGWRDHRADFTVAYSREWEIWTKHSGKGAAFTSSEAFALFLEDNAPDIVKPDPATMLAIALNFRVKADVSFSVAQRLEDGNVELGYANVVQGSSIGSGGGKVKIPENFTIKIPVFEGLHAKCYTIDARFRYRLQEGKLTMWYELVRPHKVVEEAFREIWSLITANTKATILHGTPE